MATLAANGSSRFSPAERPAILAALEEFTNALAIYHSTLRKPTEHDNDILVDCLPLDTEYVTPLYFERNFNVNLITERKAERNGSPGIIRHRVCCSHLKALNAEEIRNIQDANERTADKKIYENRLEQYIQTFDDLFDRL